MSDPISPPRENLIRAVMPGVELRAASDDDEGKVLFGHFARFNEWTEIDSMWEGHFMERFAPGAFKKTFREGRERMRLLFQHGHDPEVGDKPIASIRELREDDEGAYYEADLFDGLPPLIMDGLRADQYGASFRFSVMREAWDREAESSDYNPLGLPERTVKESKVPEFGPVTFPAYIGASAGVRSLTDEFLMSAIRADPDKAREMFDRAISLKDITPASEQAEDQQDTQDAPSEDDAEATGPHLADERREDTPTPRRPIYGTRRKETPSWLLGPSRSTRRS